MTPLPPRGLPPGKPFPKPPKPDNPPRQAGPVAVRTGLCQPIHAGLSRPAARAKTGLAASYSHQVSRSPQNLKREKSPAGASYEPTSYAALGAFPDRFVCMGGRKTGRAETKNRPGDGLEILRSLGRVGRCQDCRWVYHVRSSLARLQGNKSDLRTESVERSYSGTRCYQFCC